MDTHKIQKIAKGLCVTRNKAQIQRVTRETIMHVKHDLSSKMCRTRELFVTFRENQR